MKIKVTTGNFPSHKAPTSEFYEQLQKMEMDVGMIPAAIKLRGRRQWLWCDITKVNTDIGYITVELKQSRLVMRINTTDIEEILLFDAARRFVEHCENIRAYIDEHGEAAAHRILDNLAIGSGFFDSLGAQLDNAIDRLHPVPPDGPPAA